jgi:hypothetical protein
LHRGFARFPGTQYIAGKVPQDGIKLRKRDGETIGSHALV